jgi:transposase
MRQVVQLTMKPGASVTEVAREHALKVNQVFKWRREYSIGELIESYPALLPVTVAAADELKSEGADQRRKTPASTLDAIHIELPGRTMISVESSAAGVNDMRRGFDGLSGQVQTLLQEQSSPDTYWCFGVGVATS